MILDLLFWLMILVLSLVLAIFAFMFMVAVLGHYEIWAYYESEEGEIPLQTDSKITGILLVQEEPESWDDPTSPEYNGGPVRP